MSSKIEEFGGWRGLLTYTLLSSLLSGAVIAGVLQWVLSKEVETWKSTRSWQLSALSEVVAPTVMLLARTKALADRYSRQMRYGEASILRESNVAVRNLLLAKAHLLPSELVRTSQCLLTHYDIWLKRFELTLADFRAKHGGNEPTPDQQFDVGFSSMEALNCGDFPEEAPNQFQKQFDLLRMELFNLPPSKG